jgi:DNA-binding NarL/FixJ family response regulator
MVVVAIVDFLPLYGAAVAAEMRASVYTDWVLLEEIGQRRSPVAGVALVSGDKTSAGIRVIRAGAYSVLCRDTSVESMRRNVEATADRVSPCRSTCCLGCHRVRDH